MFRRGGALPCLAAAVVALLWLPLSVQSCTPFTLQSAVLDVDNSDLENVTATITLQFLGSVAGRTVNWTAATLHEGFFEGRPVAVLAEGPQTTELVVEVDAAEHVTLPFALDHALELGVGFLDGCTAAVDAATVDLQVTYTNTSLDGYGHVPFPDTVCSTFNGTVVGALRIDTLALLRQFAAQRCTVVTFSLEVANLALTPAQYMAGLASLQEVEGYLLVGNVDNFDMAYFGRLTFLGTANPPSLHAGVDGMVLQNCSGLTVEDLRRWDLALRAGRLHISGNPGLCMARADLEPRWWGDAARALLAFNDAGCPDGCPLHDDPLSGLCTSHCPGCPVVCDGGTITYREDLEAYAGRGCSYISGFLSFENAVPLSEAELAVFANVTDVETMLTVSGCRDIVSLDFLRSLVNVDFVLLENNERLVDARLPSLAGGVPVVHNNNRRLCALASPCGFLNVTAVMTLAGVAIDGFNTSAFVEALGAEFGVAPANASLTVTAADEETLHVAFAMLFAVEDSRAPLLDLTEGGAGAAVFARLQAATPAYSGFNLTAPLRTPPEHTGYDLGISITQTSSQVADLGSVRFGWNDPALTLAQQQFPLLYLVEYSVQPSAADVQAFASFLTEEQLADGSAETVAVKARRALEVLYGFDAFDAGGANAADLEACAEGSQAVGCLQTDERYTVRIAGFVGVDSFESYHIDASVVDTTLRVRALAATATPESIAVQWAAPIVHPDVASNNPIVGYRVQFRYHVAGNAEWDSLYGSELPSKLAAFSNELLVTGALNERRRVEVLAGTTAFDSPRCFTDFVSGGEHCLAAWTQYRITVRTLGQNFDGAVSSFHVSTPEGAPTHPVRLSGEADALAVSARLVAVKLLQPEVATGRLVAFVVMYHETRTGEEHTFRALTGRATAAQVAFPDDSYSVQVPDLLPFHDYVFSVSAETAAGVGVAAQLFNVSTPEGVPDQMPPPTVVGNPAGDGFLVTWAAPDPPPGVITRYEVWRSFDTSQDSGELLYNGTDLSIVVGDLGTGISVAAFTSAGGSDVSEAGTVASGSRGVNSGAIAGSAIAAIVCIALVVVLLFYAHRQLRSNDSFERPEADRWEVNRKQVILGQKLGQGAFGIVWKGTTKSICELRNVTVAVKQCAGEDLTDRDRNDFLAEATLMKKFADPWHQNVIRLLGVVTQDEPMMIVTEFMARGDLQEVLRKARPTGSTPAQISTLDLLYMAWDVASGMNFLASRDFIHRDLACRNCLVAEDMTVKIADFGLSREIRYKDYYRKNGEALLPVRWMAPECLADGVFTVDTDVWSYGIVLWEMITFAQMPYPGMSNQEVYQSVMRGYRMERPEACPPEIYAVMRQCWAASKRPKFDRIEEDLKAIVKNFELGGSDTPLVQQARQTNKRHTRASMFIGANGSDDEDAGLPPLKPNAEYRPMELGDGAATPPGALHEPSLEPLKQNSLYQLAGGSGGSTPSSVDAAAAGGLMPALTSNPDYQSVDAQRKQAALADPNGDVTLKPNSAYAPHAPQAGPGPGGARNGDGCGGDMYVPITMQDGGQQQGVWYQAVNLGEDGQPIDLTLPRGYDQKVTVQDPAPAPGAKLEYAPITLGDGTAETITLNPTQRGVVSSKQPGEEVVEEASGATRGGYYMLGGKQQRGGSAAGADGQGQGAPPPGPSELYPPVNFGGSPAAGAIVLESGSGGSDRVVQSGAQPQEIVMEPGAEDWQQTIEYGKVQFGGDKV